MLNNFLKHCSFTSTCEAALYHFCNISWFVILKHTLNPLPKITEAEPTTETFSTITTVQPTTKGEPTTTPEATTTGNE